MVFNRLILLTPYHGTREVLEKTIESVISQLDKKDIWIIVLDNQCFSKLINKKKYDQLIFLKNSGLRGAGNCRNLGLDYIAENLDGNFLLLPFDGDDIIEDNGVELIKQTMINSSHDVISFAHKKLWPNGTSRVIGYDGVFNIKDLLNRYLTPCGSTVVKINDPKILKSFRFGSRFRVNDALFFYQAVKYFGKFKCSPKVVLNYKVGNPKSLSGKKLLMIYYKYLSLRDFGLSNYQTIYYTFRHIINGIRRYYFKQSI